MLYHSEYSESRITFIFSSNRNQACLRASQAALVVKNLPDNAGDKRDAGSIPGLGRSSEEGNGNPLQYSCLKNPIDRGGWWAIVHRVAKGWIQLKQPSTHTHLCNY